LHRAAEQSRVQVARWSRHFELEGDGTAQRRGEGGTPGPEHRHIGDDGDVGAELVAPAREQGGEVRAPDLLLALEQAHDVDGEAPRRAEPRADRRDVGEQLPLVVAGAAAVHRAVAHAPPNGGVRHSPSGSAGCTS
jgi:hypothetical protein